MRRSRFSEEQIVGIVKEADAGTSSREVCRRHDISRETFYRWKAKYGGFTVSEARRVKQLEEENRQLKQLVADLAPDVRALRGVLEKKF